MHLMIVEPIGSGHHMALYVRYVARKVVESGVTLSLLTTKSAVAHPSYKLVEADVGKAISIYFLPEIEKSASSRSVSVLINQIKAWFVLRRTFSKIIEHTAVDVIYVPTLDWIAKGAELLGSPFFDVPFVALYMSPKHHRKRMGLGPPSRNDIVYDKLFQRLLKVKTLHNLLVIDEFFFAYCKNHYGELAEKVQYVPDFGQVHGSGPKTELKELLGVSADKKLLLVYGSLTGRKGIVELIQAFSDPSVPDGLVILLAGRPDEDIEAFLKTPPVQRIINAGRIITRLYFHDDQQESRVFWASDYTWLGYVSGFYASSGVLYQSISIGLPVIAMQEGLIGQTVRKYSLGVLVDPSHKGSIVQALVNICEYPDKKINQSEIESFAEKHTAERHVSSVYDSLKITP